MQKDLKVVSGEDVECVCAGGASGQPVVGRGDGTLRGVEHPVTGGVRQMPAILVPLYKGKIAVTE